jgi:hypothetical protein
LKIQPIKNGLAENHPLFNSLLVSAPGGRCFLMRAKICRHRPKSKATDKSIKGTVLDEYELLRKGVRDGSEMTIGMWLPFFVLSAMNAAAIANRVVMQKLRRQRWTLEQLRRQPKRNKVKATMAKQNNCERVRR